MGGLLLIPLVTRRRGKQPLRRTRPPQPSASTSDDLGRLTDAKRTVPGGTTGNVQATFSYYASAQRAGVSRFGGTSFTAAAVSAYSYDNLDRLTTLTYAQGGTALATFTYQYDAADRLTQETGPSATQTYEYWDDNQL